MVKVNRDQSPLFQRDLGLSGAGPQPVPRSHQRHHRPVQVTLKHQAVLRPFMQQFLYFLPLPQGQGALRPTLAALLRMGAVF